MQPKIYVVEAACIHDNFPHPIFIGPVKEASEVLKEFKKNMPNLTAIMWLITKKYLKTHPYPIIKCNCAA